MVTVLGSADYGSFPSPPKVLLDSAVLGQGQNLGWYPELSSLCADSVNTFLCGGVSQCCPWASTIWAQSLWGVCGVGSLSPGTEFLNQIKKKKNFIVVLLQLSEFSPQHSPPPQPNPHPSLASTLPLGFVHVSFFF